MVARSSWRRHRKNCCKARLKTMLSIRGLDKSLKVGSVPRRSQNTRKMVRLIDILYQLCADIFQYSLITTLLSGAHGMIDRPGLGAMHVVIRRFISPIVLVRQASKQPAHP